MLSVIKLNVVFYFIVMLNVFMLTAIMLSIIMLNVIMLSAIGPNVIMLNVIMLSVVALAYWDCDILTLTLFLSNCVKNKQKEYLSHYNKLD